MDKDVFVVIDDDSFSRNSVSRLLSEKGYAFPAELPNEVEPYWPTNAWLIVRDDPALLDCVSEYMGVAGIYHPVIAYGQTTLNRLGSLFNQGLVGYISWPDSDGTFLEQVDQCMRDAAPRVSQCRISSRALHRVRLLSSRESQVIALMSEGKSNKEIAKILAISPRTVEIHRANALAKLELDSSIAAAVQFQIAHLGRQPDRLVLPNLPHGASLAMIPQVVNA